MNKIIELKNITKSFDGQVVLDNINLDIYDNEFITLLGPSGCGKTTTLRLIGGFETPDSGDVIFLGDRINELPPHKRNVNTVFQRYALFPHLNVYENIAFPLRERKVNKAEIDAQVKEMLGLVALTGFEKRSVNSLSGGQQQRVAIARALINRPKVLLLDEPLAALDLKLRKDMQQELKNIHKATGITFVFVTHDQEEALTMSDKIVLLNQGEIEQQGDPYTIYSRPATVFASDFLGKANLVSGTLTEDAGRWYIQGDGFRLQVEYVGGNEGDEVKAAARGEYFELCSEGEENSNTFKLDKKIFTGLSWKLIGSLGNVPMDISALGTVASHLEEGSSINVRIRPEHIVYYHKCED